MNDTIFLIDEDGKLKELKESGFLTEDVLQELLAKHPNLMAGNQIDPINPRKWLLISREFGVPDFKESGNRWSLDHLFIDQDGIPTLVEVKRSTDTRIRREVIGQILDYAANAVTYWRIERIIQLFEKTCDIEGVNADLKLTEFLSSNLESNEFWETVETNLQAGRVRMLIVSDIIPKELQRIIEFLNEQMSPAEILGVEIKQYKQNLIKTLVPRVVGQTIVALDKKSIRNNREKWTEISFFEELEKNTDKTTKEIAIKILNWSKMHCSRIWYGSGRRGSMLPVYYKNRDHQLFAILTDGNIEIYFQWYASKAPFDKSEKRKVLLDKLNLIKGVNINEDKLGKRPSYNLKFMDSNIEINKLFEAYEWFIKEINDYEEKYK